MRMNEEQLHNFVTKNVKQLSDLTRTTANKYCTYDAYNAQGVIEYKCRRKFYPGSTQMERKKFDKNIKKAEDYLYIVYDGAGKVCIWNVSKLDRARYDFDWRVTRCPATTDFNNNEYINKETGYLKWKDALATFNVTEEDLK